MIRVADYILKRISEEGVGHLFYVPGGQCVYLMDALRRAEEAGDIQGIATHHEQAAAYAAVAYSQHTKNIGACLVTTGCAGTNVMTGLLHAWQDSIPCIVVSGQQNVEQTTHNYFEKTGVRLRQIGVQEADIVELVKPLTKYAVMLDDPAKVAYEVDRAIFAAREGRQGPVWIDVPLNIQNSMVDEEKLERYDKYITIEEKWQYVNGELCMKNESTGNEELVELLGKSIMTAEDRDYILDALEKSERPIVVAGNGVISAHAEDVLKAFLEKAQIPAVSSRLSVDLMETDYKWNVGCVSPVSGNRHANFAIQNADLVLSIGSRLAIDFTGPERSQFARDAKIIVVDIDEEEHKKEGVRIDRFVKADAKDTLEKLVEAFGAESGADEKTKKWLEKCNHWKEAFRPYEYSKEESDLISFKRFLHKLSDYLPENTTIVSDAGFTGAIVPANVKMKSGDRMIHSFAQGEMGFTLPGCFGTACAKSAQKADADNQSAGITVGITGDGSLMMNLQEFQTWVRNGFKIKLIINNNNGYSGVRHGQKAHFRGKSIGTDPSNGLDFPDFGKMAEAFGIGYVKIEKTSEIEAGLKNVFADDKPCICEVITDPDEFDLHNALVMYGKRKFGFRPIEDQSPFVDRDIFYEEMIVEPMEESSGKPM